ncbi:hypothetical protein CO230_02550 [Chryseobacterium sp. 6424]|uniref:hypothetical protein n=1 Tax=Chryseobacterium sp. 6424 TaxID=2039166 RepID=UPI000EFAC168|nr:hypothetical protein [Chryseobacterium sp. 6424]AYO57104.1 hypothetical protein CO230_02550 [Chryseobacterium sp. 6424]
MNLYYKIFLALFVIFIGFNLYAMEWQLGFWHNENSKFILSMSAAVIGILVVFVMNTMSRLANRK